MALEDVSCGGAAVRCHWTLAPGVEATVDPPEACGVVSGRVVRTGDGILVMVSRQDAEPMARVDRAIAALARERAAA